MDYGHNFSRAERKEQITNNGLTVFFALLGSARVKMLVKSTPVVSFQFLKDLFPFNLGRVLVGWFSDFPWVNSLFVTNMAILLSGISVLVMPFCVSYTAFVCVALMFGLYVAAYISLTSIILVIAYL